MSIFDIKPVDDYACNIHKEYGKGENMKIISEHEITKRHRVIIERNILIELIRNKMDIPDNAKIKFTVPSGGDYSGMEIDVDAENPIVVTWEEKSKKTLY